MKRLVNTSNWDGDLDRFGKDSTAVDKFLSKFKMDGIEFIQCGDIDFGRIDRKNIVGLHLPYYAMCMDLFNNDINGMAKTFGSLEISREFYNGDREDVVRQYKNQLKLAKELNAEYVVFHVSHVLIEDCYNYKYDYNDEQVIDATIKFINDVLDGEQYDFYFLLENLWWPGLTLLNDELTKKLIDKVNYGKKGLMLDTGHLINTSTDVTNENQAIEYIVNTLTKMGPLCKYIKGVHLNLSLSSEYVKNSTLHLVKMDEPHSYDEYIKQFSDVYEHIFNIDHHKPFTNKDIKNIFKYINPEFLVYEFIAKDRETLEQYINIQNESLK